MRYLKITILSDEEDQESVYIKTNIPSNPELLFHLVDEEVLTEDKASNIGDIENIDPDEGFEFKEVLSNVYTVT